MYFSSLLQLISARSTTTEWCCILEHAVHLVYNVDVRIKFHDILCNNTLARFQVYCACNMSEYARTSLVPALLEYLLGSLMTLHTVSLVD